MNFSVLKPYSSLFYITLLTGLFLALSSNNWIAVWIGLELNIYSFIPLLLQSNFNQEKEAAVKYFLVQALASGILLLSIISTSTSLFTFIISISLCIKLGIAPCHFWFPIVISALSWKICWLLSTIQKITPLALLTQTLSFSNPIILRTAAALRALTGGIGGINQTQIRSILAYSSINHLGWITARSLYSTLTTLIYFLRYFIIISSIIIILAQKQIFAAKPLLMKTSPNTFIWNPYMLLALLSLGGLPPLFGFFPKLLILYTLLYSDQPSVFLSFILIFSSTVRLYYYLKIIFNIALNFPSTPQGPLFYLKKNTTELSPLITIIFLTSTITGVFIFLLLL